MIIWRMSVACWVTIQQCLQERTQILRLHVHCQPFLLFAYSKSLIWVTNQKLDTCSHETANEEGLSFQVKSQLAYDVYLLY